MNDLLQKAIEAYDNIYEAEYSLTGSNRDNHVKSMEAALVAALCAREPLIERIRILQQEVEVLKNLMVRKRGW